MRRTGPGFILLAALFALAAGCDAKRGSGRGDGPVDGRGEDASGEATDPVLTDALHGDTPRVDTRLADALLADGPEPPPGIAWVDLGLHPLDARGASPVVQIPFEVELRYLAIRTTAGEGASPLTACFRLEPVTLASGAMWVDEPSAQALLTPVCTACTQRVYSGNGYGFFVFPNDGMPLEGPDTLAFRVQMRDCATGVLAMLAGVPDLPAAVRVEVATEVAVDPIVKAQLDVRVAVDPGAELAPATWEAAWAGVTALYANAGIALHLSRVATLTAPLPMPLLREPGSPEAMDVAYRNAMEVLCDRPADTRFLPVVLVPCLEAMDPVTQGAETIAGQCPRIPGGAPAGGSASAVFVAVGNCEGVPRLWSDAQHLTVLLAHEMGHYLGLYHTDSPAVAHRAPAGPGNVMESWVPGIDPAIAGWSNAQRDVMARHPDVVCKADSQEAQGN